MLQRDLPRIVSVDDHVVEPPDLFERWLPKKFGDRAPRVERWRVGGGPEMYVNDLVQDPDGQPADVWIFGSSTYVARRPVIVLKDVETSPEYRGNEPVTYEEMRPSCYDPKERVKDMWADHVEASLAFPSFPRACGQAFAEQTVSDRELGLACVKAYNDWMVEEWCGDAGGRLIPLPVVPLWDSALAAQEVERNAGRGVRAVAFSEVIGHLGFPSINTKHWDPFFAACEETGTVICMHIGSSSKKLPLPPGASGVVQATMTFFYSCASVADFVFSGVLDRFPSLKLAYSEGQAGWLPYVTERMDHAYAEHTWGHGDHRLDELPSTYVRRNVFGCIFADRHAIESAEEIGIKNLMFETDFPHADGSYPSTYDHIRQQFDGIDEHTTHQILRGNAIRLFQLDLT